MSEVVTITAADVGTLKMPTPQEQIATLNIQLSELNKELESETGCAAHHEKLAENSRNNAKAVQAKIDAITQARDAIQLPAAEDGGQVA